MRRASQTAQHDTAIRPAAAADVPAIARIHLDAWKRIARARVPAAVLDTITLQAEERTWRARLRAPEPGARLWVAAFGDEICGFAGTAPCTEPDVPPPSAVLRWIYLREAWIGTGLGRRLFTHAIDDVRNRGFRHGVLWVVERNARARDFYARAAGWAPDGARRARPVGAFTLPYVRYARALPASAPRRRTRPGRRARAVLGVLP